jgi:predicted metal-dependent peptidase
MYLPAMRSEAMGPIAVAIDTSGSIDQVTLNQFAAELQSIVDETKPARVHVIYCDAKVQRIDTFEQDDVIEMHPKGGGGTAFAPAIDAAEQFDEPPVALVYLTDLMGSFRTEPPSMPVLWTVTGSGFSAPPYGEVVPMERS